MSIPAITTLDTPDPDSQFTTVTALVALLNTLISTELPDDLTPYVIGSTTPAVDDQDKAWIRKDGSGNPLGTYVFKSGFWVREAPPPGAQWGMYFGNPAVDFNSDGTGKKGAGPVAGTYYGWALMDGQGGRGNFSDKFLIGAKMDNLASGYSSGWRTTVTGSPLVTGGAATHTTALAEIYRAAKSAVTAAHYTADGNTRDATGGIWGKDAGDGTGDPFDVVAADAGNTSPTAFSIVPPFYACAWIQYIGPVY